MYRILMLNGSSWSEVDSRPTLEQALAAAPPEAQIELDEGGRTTIVRMGTV